MADLRIGVNALYLIPGGVGGTEIYLRGLLGGLATIDSGNTYVIFTNRETGDDLAPSAPNFISAPTSVRASNRPARILWEQTRLPAAVRRERLDVLFNPGFTSPARCPCPTVTVFHDLQHKRHPEYFRWFDLPFWNLFLGQAARTSTALICVSGATAEDLERFYPGTKSKIRVIHHGVEERFRAISRERAPEPFLLCVSTLHPHKNLERLVWAFAAFRRSFPEYNLVLAGMRGFHASPVEEAVRRLGLEDSMRITGWISRDRIFDLYRRAWAFVYPSTFEGFGIPVLEAMAAGVPVACSNIPPLLEVAGEATLLFDPNDEESIHRALTTIVANSDLRAQLSAAGVERAASFTWEACARATLDVLRETAESKAG